MGKPVYLPYLYHSDSSYVTQRQRGLKTNLLEAENLFLRDPNSRKQTQFVDFFIRAGQTRGSRSGSAPPGRTPQTLPPCAAQTIETSRTGWRGSTDGGRGLFKRGSAAQARREGVTGRAANQIGAEKVHSPAVTMATDKGRHCRAELGKGGRKEREVSPSILPVLSVQFINI